MASLDDVPIVEPRSRAEWRAWLEANHATAPGAWLVALRKAAGRPVTYEDQIEEALCFGWVDGRAAPIDAERSKLHFSPRRTGSGWAATNKARIERLLASGRMAPAGIAAVERAKADGSWTLYDSPERLEVPPDLAAELDARPSARTNWEAFPPSARKMALAWIATAKRPDTRARRVEATAAMAERNERPDRAGVR
jgi:uncharacterized protein YdeI (YjbR/CyaY-like superfamily)